MRKYVEEPTYISTQIVDQSKGNFPQVTSCPYKKANTTTNGTNQGQWTPSQWMMSRNNRWSEKLWFISDVDYLSFDLDDDDSVELGSAYKNDVLSFHGITDYSYQWTSNQSNVSAQGNACLILNQLCVFASFVAKIDIAQFFKTICCPDLFDNVTYNFWEIVSSMRLRSFRMDADGETGYDIKENSHKDIYR